MKTEATNALDARIGTVIRTRRKLLGMSQTQLADAMGLSFQQINKYERGVNTLHLPRAVDICKVLNLTLAELVEIPDGVVPEASARLSRNFNQLPPDLQVIVTSLVRSLAKQGGNADA